MPLRCGPLPRRLFDPLPVPGLLLQHLPQDGRRWRLRYQPRRRLVPLKVEGEENLAVYRARIADRDNSGQEKISPARRHFCRRCGSAMWLYDPRWPELVHPFASAIDTPLPKPPEKVRIMLEFAASWCEIPEGDNNERHFPSYPDESIEEWHRRHGLYEKQTRK